MTYDESLKTYSATGIESSALLGVRVRLQWVNCLGETRYAYGNVWKQLAANHFECGGIGWIGSATREQMELLEAPNGKVSNADQ